MRVEGREVSVTLRVAGDGLARQLREPTTLPPPAGLESGPLSCSPHRRRREEARRGLPVRLMCDVRQGKLSRPQMMRCAVRNQTALAWGRAGADPTWCGRIGHTPLPLIQSLCRGWAEISSLPLRRFPNWGVGAHQYEHFSPPPHAFDRALTENPDLQDHVRAEEDAITVGNGWPYRGYRLRRRMTINLLAAVPPNARGIWRLVRKKIARDRERQPRQPLGNRRRVAGRSRFKLAKRLFNQRFGHRSFPPPTCELVRRVTVRDKNSPARHGGKRDEAFSQLPSHGFPAPPNAHPHPHRRWRRDGSGVRTLVRSCTGNALGKFVSCFGQEGSLDQRCGWNGGAPDPTRIRGRKDPRLANAGCRTLGGLKKGFRRRSAFEGTKHMGECICPLPISLLVHGDRPSRLWHPLRICGF